MVPVHSGLQYIGRHDEQHGDVQRHPDVHAVCINVSLDHRAGCLHAAGNTEDPGTVHIQFHDQRPQRYDLLTVENQLRQRYPGYLRFGDHDGAADDHEFL